MPNLTGNPFDYVIDSACSGVTVLTANTRSSRAILAACDKRLARNAEVWLTPEVLPLASWIQKTFSSAQVAGLSNLVSLNRIQSHAIWQALIGDAPTSELLVSAGLSGEAGAAWRIVHAHRIPLTKANFNVSGESRKFYLWAEGFHSECKKHGWVDPSSVVDELINIVPMLSGLLSKRILIWGFGELNPQQLALLDALKDAGIHVEVCEQVYGDVSSAKRIEFKDSNEELQYVARWARIKLLKDPAVQLGVIVPGIEALRSQVEIVFTEVLHPEFFAGVDTPSRAFHIGDGSPLASYPTIHDALLLLKLMTDHLSFAELRKLFLSPCFLPDERYGRAVAIHELGEICGEHADLSTLLHKLQTSKLDDVPCSGWRRMLSQLRDVVWKLPTSATMNVWISHIMSVLKLSGWPGTAGASQSVDSLQYQLLAKWSELLSDLATLDVVSGNVNLGTAIRRLDSAVAETKFAPENTGAPIQIIAAQEATGSRFDGVWVSGLTDEAWPLRTKTNALIPVGLQRRFKVPGSSTDMMLSAGTEMTRRLIGSAKEVFLSSPMRDGDRELRMSPLIRKAEFISVNQLIHAEHPLRQWIPVAQCEEFPDEQAPSIAPDEVLRRGTKLLELQSNCPFRSFAELRLGANESREPDAGIGHLERGNVLERVMEYVWDELRNHHVLTTTPPAEIDRIVDTAISCAMNERSPDATANEFRRRLSALEHERIFTLVHVWLEREGQRLPFHKVEHQRKITFNIGGLEMRGQIDRIDTVQGQGILIFDYKAGKKANYSPGKWKLPRPASPQLPFYAVAANTGDHPVLGLAFALLDGSDCEFNGFAVDPELIVRRQQTMNHYTDNRSLAEQIDVWGKEFEKLVREHLAGNADVKPKVGPGRNNSTCDRCHLHALCRVGEISLPVSAEEEEYDE